MHMLIMLEGMTFDLKLRDWGLWWKQREITHIMSMVDGLVLQSW